MPQVAIYLDKETAERLDKAAERGGQSRSALAGELLRNSLPTLSSLVFWEAVNAMDIPAPALAVRENRAESDSTPPYAPFVPDVPVWLDRRTADAVAAESKKAGLTTSAFVREALIHRLMPEYLPAWWFDLLGTWEDDRTPEQIMRDIREGSEQPDRVFFDD
jgi:predicted DNA-binding protein